MVFSVCMRVAVHMTHVVGAMCRWNAYCLFMHVRCVIVYMLTRIASTYCFVVLHVIFCFHPHVHLCFVCAGGRRGHAHACWVRVPMCVCVVHIRTCMSSACVSCVRSVYDVYFVYMWAIVRMHFELLLLCVYMVFSYTC